MKKYAKILTAAVCAAVMMNAAAVTAGADNYRVLNNASGNKVACCREIDLDKEISDKCEKGLIGTEVVIDGKECLIEYFHDKDSFKGHYYMLNGWYADRFYYKDGGKIKDKKVKVNGTVYYFDKSGHSVPASVSDAEPREFCYVEINKDVDKEAENCGIGRASAVRREKWRFDGIYSGIVLVDGSEADISLGFDQFKNLSDVHIKVKGDHTVYFEKIFDDLYNSKVCYPEKNLINYNGYGNRSQIAHIAYNNGYTEVYYGHLLVG